MVRAIVPSKKPCTAPIVVIRIHPIVRVIDQRRNYHAGLGRIFYHTTFGSNTSFYRQPDPCHRLLSYNFFRNSCYNFFP